MFEPPVSHLGNECFCFLLSLPATHCDYYFYSTSLMAFYPVDEHARYAFFNSQYLRPFALLTLLPIRDDYTTQGYGQP